MSNSEASGRLLGCWKIGSGSVVNEEGCSVVVGLLKISDELLGFFVGLIEACLGALNVVFDDLVFRGLFRGTRGRLNDSLLLDLVTLSTGTSRLVTRVELIASRRDIP